MPKSQILFNSSCPIRRRQCGLYGHLGVTRDVAAHSANTVNLTTRTMAQRYERNRRRRTGWGGGGREGGGVEWGGVGWGWGEAGATTRSVRSKTQHLWQNRAPSLPAEELVVRVKAGACDHAEKRSDEEAAACASWLALS